MVKLILFIAKEYQYILTAMDLTDNGTKVFGEFFYLETEKVGDLQKIIQGRIVAAVCNDEFAYDDSIKTLSDGRTFFVIEDFPKIIKRLML